MNNDLDIILKKTAERPYCSVGIMGGMSIGPQNHLMTIEDLNNEIDINVLVNNVGIINKENVLLQLIINNASVGQQLISLNTSSSKTFHFKTSLPNPGSYSCMVELDNDHKLDDNRFSLPSRLLKYL